MKSECRACKTKVEMGELAEYPFVCKGCLSKHMDKFIRAQAEGIEMWKKSCCEKRSPAARQRFSESIERGLKALNL
jgi:hypothetical protein